MRELALEDICKLPGRGLEIGLLPNGNAHAISGDTELKRPGLMRSSWTAFDFAGEVLDERKFDGPAWLPIFWKGRQVTAVTESRQAEKGHYQHRSRLLILEKGKEPETLDEFDWECCADRPNVIGEHMWIGVSRGVGHGRVSFAWKWDGRKTTRFPIGRKMDWMSTPIAVSAGVIACEVESFLAKEECAGAVLFLENGSPVTKTPWIAGGGEAAGKVFWIRERLWVWTSRGALECFTFQGSKLVKRPLPGWLGPVAGMSRDAPGRLELYDLLGADAVNRIDPEARLEWVVPVEEGALVGYWSFRKFVVRRLRRDGSAEAEHVIKRGGVSMRRPVSHPLAGLVGLLSDGAVVTIADPRGTATSLMPAVRG